jgi:hypothetical protein
MVLKVNVVGALHLETVHGFLCFGYINLVVISVGHGFFSLALSISNGGLPSQFVAAIVV